LLRPAQGDGGPAWLDADTAEALDCGLRTVERVRQRFVERGLDDALTHQEQQTPRRQRVLDGAAEARLIALACSQPPDGRAGWTLRLLADRLVDLEGVEAVSREAGRRGGEEKKRRPAREERGGSRPRRAR